MGRMSMVVGVAALLFAVGGGVVAWKAQAEALAVRADTEAARSRAEAAEAAAARVEEEAAAASRAARDASARVQSLEAEVARLRAALASGGGGGPVAGRGGAPGVATGEPDAMTTPEGDGDEAARKAEFQALRDKFFTGRATAEEQARFWELARSPGVVDGLLKDLEAAVENDPGNVGARMDLASGYVAKLFTVPAGPEMGLWATKAEDQWKTVLEQDEEHWDARFALGTSWSRYPEFLNKTPDALEQFETLRKVQEARAPEDKHGQTYVQLHLLYLRQGNEEKAREALESGLRRHPEDAEIRKSLESLK